MDFSKLKKEELLQMVVEQQTLKDAVEAKDNEIQKLVKEKEELKRKNYELSHLGNDIKQRDEHIQHLESQLKKSELLNQEHIQKLEAVIKEQQAKIHQDYKIEEIIKENKSLVEQAEFAVNIANKYINTFRNYLKFQQGSLDNMIEMEAMLTKQIQTKEV
jgi:predicted RNase H-like nuclease (RuvC/YqgF family)